MARMVTETITDDLDGSEGASTVSFGLDGTSYSIDLNEKNAAALRRALEKYIAAVPKSAVVKGRRKGPVRSATSARRAGQTAYDRDAFRAWAVANDIQLTRGRPPRALRERFEAETPRKRK